jgi:hypothetical protein
VTAVDTPFNADIGIGGTQVRLHCADRDFLDSLGERYAGFLGPTRIPDYEFVLDLYSPQGDVPDDDVTVFRRDRLWCLRRGDFQAEWDPVARTGSIRMPPSPYSLDSVLRIVHTLLLAPVGGMLMHSSSAVRGGRA